MPAVPIGKDPERDQETSTSAADRLVEAAHAEQRTLAQQIAISSAEKVVAEARCRSLLAAQDAAARRLSAARGAARVAGQTDDHDRRAAAHAAVAAAQADFTRVTDAAIEELRGITQAERTRLEGLVEHLRRVWTAREAADIAVPPPDRRD
ncbi:hypothetical protein [Amycolatopsis sp. cmx-8-4]|uniref:hypothetical protein n=1 Tax=Amycolatopsis sp. cmx-8-4 TaxID=2790947 RepID=UPI00397E66D3